MCFLLYLGCSCNSEGSKDLNCDDSGICRCKSSRFEGNKCKTCGSGYTNSPLCDQCAPGYYGFPNCQRGGNIFLSFNTFFWKLKIFLQNLNKFCQILKFFNGSRCYVFQISNFMGRSIGWQPQECLLLIHHRNSFWYCFLKIKQFVAKSKQILSNL